MLNHFNPRKVLRQVSNQLLCEFFTRRDQLDDIPWPYLPETCIQPIFASWQGMPKAERKEIQVVFQNIHALADHRGLRVLAEEIQQRCPEKAAEFTECQGRYDKAMWAYLTVPEVFAEAALFARADALSTGRYWVTHNSLPRQPLAVSAENARASRSGWPRGCSGKQRPAGMSTVGNLVQTAQSVFPRANNPIYRKRRLFRESVRARAPP